VSVTVRRGEAPLIVSLPHTGMQLPDAIIPRLVSVELARKDTDWRIEELYGFSGELGATILHTTMSRTVIDVNRDPSGRSLYPGQATTGLVPVETFDGEALYHDGEDPDKAEIEERRRLWFEPYHEALRTEIRRLGARHRRLVIYDCHSIRSRVPRLFPGELPVFNIGTNGGTSCDAGLSGAVAEACRTTGESLVVDGRFRGGWITRHYGMPGEGVNAIQMELAQRLYLDEAKPEQQDLARAERAQAMLRGIVGAALGWARS
jgi:N-formylglutamate deformylase